MASADKIMLRVDAMQTATPGRMTAAGRARRVSPSAAALRSRFQVVLYYREAGGGGGGGEEEGEALKVAAWMKESLSAALPEHPVLAGRLRRRDEQGGGGWEVKLNDSGVRLVQATAETTMAELMEAEDAREKELHLAYWEDGDPDHSSLFCVQVTKIDGGGYSIGISCSLLLADPLFLSNFIRAWAQTHTQMLSQGLLTQSPMFHLSNFRKPTGRHPIKSVEVESNPIDSSSAPTITMLFKANRNSDSQSYSMIAMACLQETTRRLDIISVLNFTLIISDHAGDVKVESCTNTAIGVAASKCAIDMAWWDQLGLVNITFTGKDKPLHLSHKIISSVDGGLVVIMVPKISTDLLISVTIHDN